MDKKYFLKRRLTLTYTTLCYIEIGVHTPTNLFQSLDLVIFRHFRHTVVDPVHLLWGWSEVWGCEWLHSQHFTVTASDMDDNFHRVLLSITVPNHFAFNAFGVLMDIRKGTRQAEKPHRAIPKCFSRSLPRKTNRDFWIWIFFGGGPA